MQCARQRWNQTPTCLRPEEGTWQRCSWTALLCTLVCDMKVAHINALLWQMAGHLGTTCSARQQHHHAFGTGLESYV